MRNKQYQGEHLLSIPSSVFNGAATGAISSRLKTGSWDGAGKAALDGAASGYMSGAITGFISGGLTSKTCFVAGTAVLTATGTVAIEKIKEGDLVYAADPDTGETALKRVVRTFVNEADELVHVFVKDEEIICTNEHPFYLPQKGWTAACELRAGDILVTVNGQYVVVEKVQHEILEQPVKVYNFEVEGIHTYFISSIAILVHNLCTNNARKQAVRKAWKNEYNNVKAGGEGLSRTWTDSERLELLTRGKVRGYQGHHMFSVSKYPSLAGNSRNIQFLTRAEHFAAHGGNWRNVTHGRYIF